MKASKNSVQCSESINHLYGRLVSPRDSVIRISPSAGRTRPVINEARLYTDGKIPMVIRMTHGSIIKVHDLVAHCMKGGGGNMSIIPSFINKCTALLY